MRQTYRIDDTESMSESQRACLACKGQCHPTCTGWIDELHKTTGSGCYIRHTEPFASHLGYEVRNSANAQVPVICERCGAETMMLERHAEHVRYCKACRILVSREQTAETKATRRTRPTFPDRACAVCGKAFKPTNATGLHCGPECSHVSALKYNEARNRERAKKRAERRVDTQAALDALRAKPHWLPCLECGQEVEVRHGATKVLCPYCRKERVKAKDAKRAVVIRAKRQAQQEATA